MSKDIFQRIEEAGSIDFGDILSKSFNLFQKTWVEALKHALVTLLIMAPFIIIVYAPIIPMYIEMLANAGDPYYTPSFVENYSAGMIIGWAFLVLLLSFLLQPFVISIVGSYLQLCKKVDVGGESDVKGLYLDIVKNHFGKLVLLSLATVGIALLAALLCYFPLFYVMVPLQLIMPVFVFNQKLSVSQIVKACFKLGNRYWFMVFGLMIVSGIISSLGFIICGIGIIVTQYYQYVVLYYFYKDSVGFDENGENPNATVVE